jgi:hypothetical protein
MDSCKRSLQSPRFKTKSYTQSARITPIAAHDFGGHRVDAVKATDEAIRQLEVWLKFDKD